MIATITQVRTFIAQNDVENAFKFIKKELLKYLSMQQGNTVDLNESNYNDTTQQRIDGIITTAEEAALKGRVKNNILTLMGQLENEQPKAEARFNLKDDGLIRDNSFPFLNRYRFRDKVLAHIHSKSSRTIFVTGEEKSGMSYLQNFLFHFTEINDGCGLKVISINMENILSNPDTNKSSKIIEILLERFGSDSTLAADEHIKFIRLTKALKEHIETKKMIPVFFFHDFHKVRIIPEDTYRLIYQLIEEQVNCLFIFTGLQFKTIPNWDQIRNGCDFYQIPKDEVTPQNIKDCFYRIFETYKASIFNSLGGQAISFDNYYENVSKRIFTNGSNVDISTVGTFISDHLFNLKSF
ncbi:MAG: hypothetical protein EOP48_15560 [Sphingobacteriales bacterium]|nr:MAG: hypothetical protein EOP48_15560 [Sphingobacteriales bacterium]